MKVRTGRNSHRLRGKRYRAGIVCRNGDHETVGRGTADIQPDLDCALGKEGIGFELCKSNGANVIVHRENAPVLIQTPSGWQYFTAGDAQSDGGCSARARRDECRQIEGGCSIGKRHGQGWMRVRRSLEMHKVSIIDRRNEVNIRYKCRIRSFVNADDLRISLVKVDRGYTEPDVVLNNGCVACGNGYREGVIIVIDKPFTGEIRSRAERDGDRLLAFMIAIIFNGDRWGNIKNASGDGGRRSDGETLGRGGVYVGNVVAVGFRVGECKGNVVDNVRGREVCAGRIPDPKHEGDVIALRHDLRSR